MSDSRITSKGSICLWAVCILFTSFSIARADLKLYETRYYNIYTDIDPQDEREAALRMTRMAEEYHSRTSDFAGQIREKLPFYLFRSPQDYYAAGGLRGSVGVFVAIGDGGKLMAIAGRHGSQQTWHTVQHEGFHQFAHQVIGGHLPVWLDEGLAEYFGESIFTGDGFVTGVIPPWRLARIQDGLKSGDFKSFDQIKHLSGDQWADQLNLKNYDQAWSMIYFLVHADDQKYQGQLTGYIRQIAQGRPDEAAWKDTLAGSGDVEERWRTWWLAQPARPTTALYGRAAVATMTSFIARAYAQKQTFADFDAFHQAVDDGTLKINPDDWLPDSLVTNAFRLYFTGPTWELTAKPGRQPVLVMTLTDGTRVTGTFLLQGQRVAQVNVEVDDLPRVLSQAQSLAVRGDWPKARAMVLAAIRSHPGSASIAEARKFLQGTR